MRREVRRNGFCDSCEVRLRRSAYSRYICSILDDFVGGVVTFREIPSGDGLFL